MAQECSGSSVAISSSTPPAVGCWWDLHHHHASSLSPWHQPNPSSNSSCEEDVSMSTSFTNASNHSGLTVESSRRLVEPAASSPNELIGEHASDSQLWSHILLGVGSNGELQNNQDVGENLLDALSSRSINSSGIFEPACDYLKKIDHNWEFTSSFNNFEKHINGFSTDHHHQSLIESDQRVTKLSNLVNNWSIAPPDPGVVSNNRDFDPMTCSISLSSVNHYSPQPQTFSDSASCGTAGMGRNSGLILSCYGSHDHVKVENDHEHQNHHRHVEAPAAGYVLRRSTFNNNGAGVGYHIGLNNGSVMADNSKYYYGTTENTSARTFNDGLTFNGRLNKPLIDIQGHKPCFKSLNLSDCRKQGLQTSSQTVRGQGNSSEGKKKRYEDTSETIPKKPKHESSTASSVKTQAPKVKLGDRITALQQIVSPFGKTDTASVLLEAIQYIKFLQEQVQLLSNPYMKSNSHKDPWGGLDKKAQGDAKVDLRSRGLCLVPISCTPQIYHENTGSDYWTPTYRGCLYR
ncbi:transcription factor bHLH111 [Ricinus communis]|uniref:transcription factor bHLH111 n=1 Tax=Ricinus communis TaxID=3988 RepID=UPI00201B139E|nr:transcription factor bHLH111 [Ricinus communis]